jgi:hypothetical protein
VDAGTETNINLNHQIYYHVLGSDQSEDILCWKDPEHPKYTFGASVTEDGKVTRSCSCHFYKDLVIKIKIICSLHVDLEEQRDYKQMFSSLMIEPFQSFFDCIEKILNIVLLTVHHIGHL